MKTSIQFAAIDMFFFAFSVVLFTVALVKRFPLITTWVVASAISLGGFEVVGLLVGLGGCVAVLINARRASK